MPATAARTEADRLKQENDAKMAAAQTELDRAANEKKQSETEKVELRAQLLLQFNAILQTRDTARGLIVNMSDVFFDTGQVLVTAGSMDQACQGGGDYFGASRAAARSGRSYG